MVFLPTQKSYRNSSEVQRIWISWCHYRRILDWKMYHRNWLPRKGKKRRWKDQRGGSSSRSLGNDQKLCSETTVSSESDVSRFVSRKREGTQETGRRVEPMANAVQKRGLRGSYKQTKLCSSKWVSTFLCHS